MSTIAKNQFSQPADWISDRKRGDDHASMVNPHDHYVEQWTNELSASVEKEAQQLADASEVFLGYKTAGVMNVANVAKNVGKQFIERSGRNAALTGSVGGAAIGAAAGGEGNRLQGALAGGALGAGAGLGGRKLIQGGNAAQAAKAQAALAKPKAQIRQQIQSGIPRAPNQAQVMRSKTRDLQRQGIEERLWAKKRMNAPAARQQVTLQAKAQSDALAAAKSGLKVPSELLSPEHQLRHAKGDGGSSKTLTVIPPLVADDSINAASSSESSAVVKTANRASLARRTLDVVKTPSLGSAASWGLIGGASAAAGAEEGDRLKAGLRAGLVGGALGAYAPHLERKSQALADRMVAKAQAKRSPQLSLPFPKEKSASPYDSGTTFDLVQRAAEKFPAEKITAGEAIKDDAEGMWELLREKAKALKEMKKKRVEVVAGPKPRKETIPAPVKAVLPAESMKVASTAMKVIKGVVNPIIPLGRKGILPGALTGVAAGGATYLASRPRDDLGGKSKGEEAWQQIAQRTQQQVPGDGGKKTPMAVKRELEEKAEGLGHSVAEVARKHPIAASLLAGWLGYRGGHKLGPLLG